MDTDATGPEPLNEKALQRQEQEAGAAVVSAGKTEAAEQPFVAEADFPVQPQGSSREVDESFPEAMMVKPVPQAMVKSLPEAMVRPAKYACTACSYPFMKWTQCRNHIFSTVACKELALDSSTLDEDIETYLQGRCKKKAMEWNDGNFEGARLQ